MNLPLPGLGRRWRHGTLAVALAAAFLLSIFALSTGTAEANASPCGFGSSSGNVETCMTIRGTGLHIDLAVARHSVLNSGRTLDLEMTPARQIDPLRWLVLRSGKRYLSPSADVESERQ